MKNSPIISRIFPLMAMMPLVVGKAINAKKLEIDILCRKKHFEDTYLHNKNAVLEAKAFGEKCSNSRSYQCAERIQSEENSLQVTYGVTNEGKDALHVYFEKGFSEMFFQDCWGVAIQINAKSESETFYFMEYDQIPEVSILVLPGEHYHIKSIYLPTGHVMYMTIRTPANQCEKSTVEELYEMASTQNLTQCAQPELHFMLRMAEEICKQENLTDKSYTNKSYTNKSYLHAMSFLEKVCMQKKLNQISEESNKKTSEDISKKIPASFFVFISLSASLIIALAVTIYLKLWRNKQYKSHRFSFRSPLLENYLEKKDNRDGLISVLILNRPGCDLLDMVMVSLCCVLKSQGIDVKLALLEQSQIDAEGGIASFMQRNIESCDYILIACSPSKPDDLPNQKPYEFAIRVIGGLAYHNNSCSRYIPIYLNDYSEAVHFIPSFLNANVHTGFKIPDDVSKLIKTLLNESYSIDKVKELKTEFFINEMKEISNKYLSDDHATCNFKGGCPMGKLFLKSVSNLSSFWASTIDSRWSSVKSILEPQSPYEINNCSANKFDILTV